MSRRKDPSPSLPDAIVVDDAPVMVIPPVFGPGDADPRSAARGVAAPASPPLGPGDDDPRAVDRGSAGVVRGPLSPGEADPNDRENRNVRMLAQPAAGPGDTFTARRLTVFPNQTKE